MANRAANCRHRVGMGNLILATRPDRTHFQWICVSLHCEYNFAPPNGVGSVGFWWVAAITFSFLSSHRKILVKIFCCHRNELLANVGRLAVIMFPNFLRLASYAIDQQEIVATYSNHSPLESSWPYRPLSFIYLF